MSTHTICSLSLQKVEELKIKQEVESDDETIALQIKPWANDPTIGEGSNIMTYMPIEIKENRWETYLRQKKPGEEPSVSESKMLGKSSRDLKRKEIKIKSEKGSRKNRRRNKKGNQSDQSGKHFENKLENVVLLQASQVVTSDEQNIKIKPEEPMDISKRPAESSRGLKQEEEKINRIVEGREGCLISIKRENTSEDENNPIKTDQKVSRFKNNPIAEAIDKVEIKLENRKTPVTPIKSENELEQVNEWEQDEENSYASEEQYPEREMITAYESERVKDEWARWDRAVERSKVLMQQMNDVRDLNEQTERVIRASRDMERTIKQMTDRYCNRIVECGRIVRQIETQSRKYEDATTGKRRLEHETEVTDRQGQPIGMIKFNLALNEEQKENEEIQVQYIIRNSRITYRVDKIDGSGNKHGKRHGKIERRSRSNELTSDQPIETTYSQPIDEASDQSDKTKPKTRKTMKRTKRIIETTDSEEEADGRDQRRKSGKKSRKEETRSEIAKRNIKLQPREPSGKFGPKPKSNTTGEKLTMNPVVVIAKMNTKKERRRMDSAENTNPEEKKEIPGQQPIATIKEEKTVEEKQGTGMADQVKKPIITSIINIPKITVERTSIQRDELRTDQNNQAKEQRKPPTPIGDYKITTDVGSIIDLPIIISDIIVTTEPQIEEKGGIQQVQEPEIQDIAANVSIDNESVDLEPTNELATEMTTEDWRNILVHDTDQQSEDTTQQQQQQL